MDHKFLQDGASHYIAKSIAIEKVHSINREELAPTEPRVQQRMLWLPRPGSKVECIGNACWFPSSITPEVCEGHIGAVGKAF